MRVQHMIVRAEHALISNHQTLINTVINMLSLHSNRSYKSPPSAHPKITEMDGAQHASSRQKHSSPSPPRFFRAALLASCPTLDSPSLGSSPSGSSWASWFSLLSPPSWLLSDFLSLRFSLSLREEGGFFPLLLRTFCCCWETEEKNF